MLILLTGEGKGKTTSAIGSAIRCVGSGRRSAIFQFVKKIESSEISILRTLMDVVVGGAGFTWQASEDETKKAANETWAQAKVALADERLFLVVLDEITYVTALIDDDIESVLSNTKCESVIITGRYPAEWMKALSDIHSDIRCVKYSHREHPTRGIEW